LTIFGIFSCCTLLVQDFFWALIIYILNLVCFIFRIRGKAKLINKILYIAVIRVIFERTATRAWVNLLIFNWLIISRWILLLQLMMFIYTLRSPLPLLIIPLIAIFLKMLLILLFLLISTTASKRWCLISVLRVMIAISAIPNLWMMFLLLVFKWIIIWIMVWWRKVDIVIVAIAILKLWIMLIFWGLFNFSILIFYSVLLIFWSLTLVLFFFFIGVVIFTTLILRIILVLVIWLLIGTLFLLLLLFINGRHSNLL